MKAPALALLFVCTAHAFAAAAAPAQEPAAREAAAQSPGVTMYCWKDRLEDDGAQLVCNWSESRADACRLAGATPIARASIAQPPQDAGRCANGQWLVKVTRR